MNDKLYYTSPAKEWHDALPLGNGRIGAMVYGAPLDEVMSLNEDSIWSGGYRDRNNSKALDHLDELRRLIREGQTDEANALCERAFYGKNDQQRHYMPAGDLHIHTDIDGEVTGYSHTLDLSKGVDEVTFSAGGVDICRRTYISYPDGVMIAELRADSEDADTVRYTVTIDGRDDYYDDITDYRGDTLLFTSSYGIPFTCAVTAAFSGGGLSAGEHTIAVTDTDLEIECETGETVYLIVGIQTAFRAMDHTMAAIDDVRRAVRTGCQRIYERHIADFASLYDRCSLSLDAPDTSMTTDEQLEVLREGGDDRGLSELYFNFSRYLMISGSRPGTLPLNLQGIWNKDMWPAWGCKYTININTEMNYWGAEMLALSECHEPLFDHIERM
ncbi:MAG: glycoside hydrolase family 95 protein, partial [Oscillospiraceae bacterium]|nr:glycoside hydrolase family 95 protein [Oscillospiraceae bacterium]